MPGRSVRLWAVHGTYFLIIRGVDNMNEHIRKEFENYMNSTINASPDAEKLESATKKLEKQFLDIIGNNHAIQLEEFVTNIMCMWLEFGFEAGYTQKESH